MMQLEVFETWMFQGSSQGWVHSALKLHHRYSKLAGFKSPLIQGRVDQAREKSKLKT